MTGGVSEILSAEASDKCAHFKGLRRSFWRNGDICSAESQFVWGSELVDTLRFGLNRM